MASIYLDTRNAYIDVGWQPSVGRAVIRVGTSSLHLTVDEAETVVHGLTAAIAESKAATAVSS